MRCTTSNSACAAGYLQTHDRAGGDMITLTHESLSQMLAVRRTTVTLVARSLQEAGAIEYRRGKISIVDRRKLEKRACECYKVVSQQIDMHLPGAQADRCWPNSASRGFLCPGREAPVAG